MTLTNEDLMALSNMMDSKLKPINDRLDKVEERLNKMDERFDQVEVRLNKMDERFDQVEARLNKMDERFDQVESQISALQSDVTKIKQTVIRNYDITEEFYAHQKEHNTLVSDRLDEVTGKLLIYTRQTEHNTLLLHDGV